MNTRMPRVLSCDVRECAYNDQNACHAIAINVGGPEPLCDTFFGNSKKGGEPQMSGVIGACKNDACAFNEFFECRAGGINVSRHDEKVLCDTFSRIPAEVGAQQR